MNVSAIIVTRGDVDLEPIFASLPTEWERVVWDNGSGWARVFGENPSMTRCEDLSVYGRYAAIEHASGDLIFCQDDDVIVSDPTEIVECYRVNKNLDDAMLTLESQLSPCGVVCNMPPEFRPNYPDSALVGFGACFHRDLPARAFHRFWQHSLDETVGGVVAPPWGFPMASIPNLLIVDPFFHRECDAIFTCLTPRVLVDVPKTDREFASDPVRLWKQSGHVESRRRMLDLARKVRDA